MFFLSERKEFVYKSYSEKQTENAVIFCMDDFQENRAVFMQTEVIFSTWGMPPLDKNKIQECFPNLKAVFYAAGSVGYFARPFLELGIKIFSAWGGNAVPVAEFTAAQIILANKGYFQLPGIYKAQGGDAARAYGEAFHGNYNTKVGLLGAGKIGRHVIELLRQYKLQLLVFDPFLPEADAEKLGVEKASLETVFTTCQTISNHLANNSKTQNILNYSIFKLMKSNAAFINTGRGAQVDEHDLLRAMQDCPARVALLDVTTVEFMPVGTPLLDCPNIFVTPHRAGSFTGEVKRLGAMIMQAHSLFVENKKSDCEITIDMLDTLA